MCHNNISAKGDVCSNEQSQANAHILRKPADIPSSQTWHNISLITTWRVRIAYLNIKDSKT